MSNLEEKFEILKSEVDALQHARLNQHTPWYKNIPVWVSILALLFSFGTTVFSYQRAESQNNQALKSELRVVLQRLSQLPTEQLEKTKKYEGDESAIIFLSSQSFQEATLLAKQSVSIAKRIPDELLTSIEYMSIALALQSASQIEEAFTYLNLATSKAEDVNDKISALRVTANLNFISGQPELGRIKYKEALNIFSKYKGFNEFIIKSAHIGTYRYWAYAEASIGRKDLANHKLEEARGLASTLMVSPGRAQLERQINQAWQEINYKAAAPVKGNTR